MGLIKNIKLALSLKKAVKEINKLKEENEDTFADVMSQVVIVRTALNRICECLPTFKEFYQSAAAIILSIGKK